MTSSLRFKRIGSHTLPLPSYESEGAAGMDVRAAAPFGISCGERALIGTGFSVEVPPGYELQVRPRSGLALRCGVTVLNSPGTIDSDYRGEIKVLLANLGGVPFCAVAGDRIAQLVLAKVERLPVEEAEELSETERGANGFGSSGVR